MVKLAAARANTEVGRMKKERMDAIEKACQAVIDGKYHDQFLTDLYQGGAGTSANMNANEVLANIALEMSGHKKGEYQFIEPHDDLNMGQSTNDVYPTAIHIALLLHNDKLIKEADLLHRLFIKKEKNSKTWLRWVVLKARMLCPCLAVKPFYPETGATDRIDDYTAQFNLLEPNAYFPGALTGQLGYVSSPTWIAAALADPTLNQKPVGTGPFVFDSRSPDSVTRFVRNDRLVERRGVPRRHRVRAGARRRHPRRTAAPGRPQRPADVRSRRHPEARRGPQRPAGQGRDFGEEGFAMMNTGVRRRSTTSGPARRSPWRPRRRTTST